MNFHSPLADLLSGNVFGFLLMIAILLISLTVHEVGHALVAYRLGDVRKEQRERITLNPIRHVDPFGAIVFLITGFGWAKPVAVNPASLKGDWWRSMALVAAAGPLMNLGLAIVTALALRYVTGSVAGSQEGGFVSLAIVIVALILDYMLQINLMLAIFNLLPIPVLDGFKVMQGVFSSDGAYKLAVFENKYGLGILGIIVVLSYFSLPIIGRLSIFSLVVSPIVSFAYQMLVGTGRL